MIESEKRIGVERVQRLARLKQKELSLCPDPRRRVVLLQERNELLARFRVLRAQLDKSLG